MNEFTGERYLPGNGNDEIRIEHTQRYNSIKHLIENKIVVDAACGEGYGSFCISQNAKMVYGIDIDAENIELAQKKYNRGNLKFRCASIAKLPINDCSVDVVVSFETIEHVNEETQKQFVKEVKRILKTDGVFIVSTPNKSIYTDLVEGENKFHIKEFYVNEFKEFLKNEFSRVALFGQTPVVGYHITDENGVVKFNDWQVNIEQCRYVIAICSTSKIDKNNLSMEIEYSNEEYYFLNKLSHKLEKELQNTVSEANEYEAIKEKEIKELQELDKQNKVLINNLKTQIQNLEVLLKNTVSEANEYESRKEKEIKELQELAKQNKNIINDLTLKFDDLKKNRARKKLDNE